MRLGTEWVVVPKTFCLPPPTARINAMAAVKSQRLEIPTVGEQPVRQLVPLDVYACDRLHAGPCLAKGQTHRETGRERTPPVLLSPR
jgi:hypothetical protein